MKAKGLFISTLLILDTFLVSYYAGVHGRTVKVIDPSLPALPVVQPAGTEKAKADETAKKGEESAKKSGEKSGEKSGQKSKKTASKKVPEKKDTVGKTSSTKRKSKSKSNSNSKKSSETLKSKTHH